MSEETLTTPPPEANGHTTEESLQELVIDACQPPRKLTVRSKSGNPMKVEIREMGSAELAQWMKVMSRRTKRDGAKARFDAAGIHPELISLCMYYADPPAGRKVPKAIIEGFGAKALNQLYAVCQEINGLDDSSVGDEGKD